MGILKRVGFSPGLRFELTTSRRKQRNQPVDLADIVDSMQVLAYLIGSARWSSLTEADGNGTGSFSRKRIVLERTGDEGAGGVVAEVERGSGRAPGVRHGPASVRRSQKWWSEDLGTNGGRRRWRPAKDGGGQRW
jgi:hypothetical protein